MDDEFCKNNKWFWGFCNLYSRVSGLYRYGRKFMPNEYINEIYWLDKIGS